jgi:hypothetical protein
VVDTNPVTNQPPTQTPPSPQPIVPPPSPQPPTPPKKPRSNWPLISGLAIVVFLLGIGVGKFYPVSNIRFPNLPFINPSPTPTSTPTPTPDPTADWKTYTDTKNTFSLKYPASLPIETSLCGGTCIEDLRFTPNPATGGSSIAVVLTSKDSRIKTLDDYKNIIVKGDSSIINVQDTKIAGNNAVSYKLSGGIPPLPIIEYAVVHNNYYYIIRLLDSDETKKDLAGNQKIFDQILSTFTFLDSNNSTSSGYICPPSGYVDCMPVLTPEKQATCSSEAMSWYKTNCPNFKGGAL